MPKVTRRNKHTVGTQAALVDALRGINMSRQLNIAARSNVSCCGSCGRAAMCERGLNHHGTGPARGYAFTHQQSIHGNDSNKCYVYFGCPDDDDDNDDVKRTAVGETVVAELKARGFDHDCVVWDGSPDTAICVHLRV